MSNNNYDKIWNRALDDIMSESFGKYAKYIIQDRALPDIRDGLKPVQRRILYAMSELKINHDKPYKKSARTVGEVIGKYHPHGDSSIYEAMVRMSQEWKNNIPLLDMQGNKGSLDGDSAAAMRYTECRLSKFGEKLLDDIDKETVKFIPNFDDSEEEPSVLPSLLPNILVNGATGIAAGYATNVPPFNLLEVLEGTIYRINNPNCTLKEIASIIKGPDFPMGGIIQGRDGILEFFATGRGKFNIRAKIEENFRSKGKKQLIVTELPYETNKATIVKAIDDLRINNELPGLKEVRDDSDKDGISIVLEFDTEKDIEILKGYLYKKTQLQISYSANVILIKDRKPCQCGLIDILDAYIEHANDIVIKSSTYDLKKALNRKEILEGLIKAISDIDNLVTLIKSSTSKDEAKQKLMDFFTLTEKQAEAVVQLRLYVLTSYDTQKLIDEYKELLEFIDLKKKLINDKNFRNKHLISKFNDFGKTLGFRRRSIIEDEIENIVVKETDIIEENNGVCVVTRDCYIKFMTDTKITDLDVNKLKIKDGDIPIDMFDLSTLDTLIILTSKGKCITIPAHKIKMTKIRENGIHVNELVTIDSFEKNIAAFSISKNSSIKQEVFVATKHSQVKRFLIEDIAPAKNTKTTTYIGLKNDDEVVSAFVVQPEHKEIISISSSGNAIRYSIDEVPILGRTASGVKNINLKNNDYVASTFPVDLEESFILLVSNRGGKRIHYEDIGFSSRATIGKKILSQVESNPYIIHSAFMIGGRQYITLLNDVGKLQEQKVADIPITDNQTRMNSFPGIEGSIIKASFIKKNKNFVIFDEINNFFTLESIKNSEKPVDNNDKNKGLNDDLEKLINTPIHQKKMNFNHEEVEIDTNNILNVLDNNEITKNIIETKTEKLVTSNEVKNLANKFIDDNIDKKENSFLSDNNELIKEFDVEEEPNEFIENNNSIIVSNNNLKDVIKSEINIEKDIFVENTIDRETNSFDDNLNNSNGNIYNFSNNELENNDNNVEKENIKNEDEEINLFSKELLTNENIDNDIIKESNDNSKVDSNLVDSKDYDYNEIDDLEINQNSENAFDTNINEKDNLLNNDYQTIEIEEEETKNDDDDFKNNESIIDAILNDDRQKALNLINSNGNVNEVDEDGQTALMIVANNDDLELLDSLISHNANLDIKDSTYGYTALMYAVQAENIDVIQKLIDANADLNIKTPSGITALYIAMEIVNNIDIGRMLVENGANDENEYFEIVYENDNDDLDELEKSLLEIDNIDDE